MTSVIAGLTSCGCKGLLDPDAVPVEKPFSDADLLAKAGQALGGHNRGLRISQETAPDPPRRPGEHSCAVLLR